MNILVIGVAIAIVVVSAIFTRNQEETFAPTETATLGEPKLTPEESSTPEETFAPIPPTPSQGISQFFYPGASVVFQSATTTSLTSSDDSGKITDWYEEKIKSMGFSAKAFVKTSSNSNVLNKLSGVKGGEEVRVEIRQAPGESLTQITIELDKD